MYPEDQDVFNILSEAIPEGVIVTNKQQRITAINTVITEIFGYTSDELIGRPIEILLPSSYHRKHTAHVDHFFKKSDKRQMGHGRDLYGAKKSGESFPVEVGLNPFELGGNTYVMALVIDISERKKTMQELKHWSNIFNESLNEIYIFTADSLKFINGNRGALKNLGYSLEELKTLGPVDIKPNYSESQFREAIEPLVTKEETKIDFETIHRRKDGSRYPVEVHLQLSKLEGDEVFIAIILDITERKNYTDNLERIVEQRTSQLAKALAKEKELNDLKTKFLSLVSHEFKTPLSGILTSTILLEKYTLTEEQNRRDKHIKTITNKVHYLNNILNDFLSIERLDSGKINYKYTQFNLSKVVNEVVYNSNMLLKSGQNINISKDIDEFDLYQDEKILELTLSNLIHNAIKYSPENSTIDLSIKERNSFIEFTIMDQGMGIPLDDQKYIFNRYFRAENALTHQGTGIGLNIVKGHIENLGGAISFSSTPDKGSTFVLALPKIIES